MPPITPLDEVRAIIGAVSIQSLAAFRFQEQSYTLSKPEQHDSAPLQNELTRVLYQSVYIRPQPPTAPAISSTDFLAALAQANSTQDRWDPGWTIYQLTPEGRVMVQKGERSRVAVPGEFATGHAPGHWPQKGDVVHVRVYPGSPLLQPSFYFAYGKTLSDQFDQADLLRFYFHATHSNAVALMHYIVSEFNYAQIPFQFKTLSDPQHYCRADAAVLYCAKRYWPMAQQIIAALPAAIRAELRADTPLFAYPLMPGLGLAEEPRTGESFGMHRCRLLAEALISAWQQALSGGDALLEVIKQRFRAEGLCLEQAYLNAGSAHFITHSLF